MPSDGNYTSLKVTMPSDGNYTSLKVTMPSDGNYTSLKRFSTGTIPAKYNSRVIFIYL